MEICALTYIAIKHNHMQIVTTTMLSVAQELYTLSKLLYTYDI